MRRAGKLDGNAAGRARLWLPPRKDEEGCIGVGGIGGISDGVLGIGGHAGAVPRRWRSECAEEDVC